MSTVRIPRQKVPQAHGSNEAMRRSLAMMKLVAQGARQVETGKVIPHGEVFRKLRKRLS